MSTRLSAAAAVLGALVIASGVMWWFRATDPISRSSPGKTLNPALPGDPVDPKVRPDPVQPPLDPGKNGKEEPTNSKSRLLPPAEVLEVYAGAFQAARPRALPPDGWRERLPTIMKWSGDTSQWSCADFGVDWPSNTLVLFGRFPEKNVTQVVRTSELESWLASQRAEGHAISYEEGQRIAEEFLGRVVPDLLARNYALKASNWRSSGQKYGGRDADPAVWYEYTFAQQPRTDLGEVLVNEASISVSVDPLSSEVACFRRGFSRLEPRIAFAGPLLSEADARRLWEDRMQPLVAPPKPRLKVVEGPLLRLVVQVTWDDHDIPSGRPLWHVTFGSVYLTDLEDDEKGVGLSGEMKIDARSSEVLLFRHK